MEERSDTTFEEREEFMVSSAVGYPTLRKAHFLKPNFTSNGGKMLELPPDCLSPKQPIHNLKDLSEKVAFKGWKRPTEKWKRWVQSLHSKHQALWKQVGIYDAVMSSRYEMKQHKELVLALAEKWCPDTNTFIFPWGEATLTLEDMMVSGGYSVLGASVLSPLNTEEQVEVERKLIEGRKEAATLGSFCATYKAWMDHFMGTGLDLEHEAFLSLWLSKFVLMKSSCASEYIGKHVFPIAIHLARGTRIALAPAVLSSIYRDLSLLKDWFFGSNVVQTNELLNLFAPFQLVQLWVWERFPRLGPMPNSISHREPRVARWHRLKIKVDDVMLAINSAGNDFQWRPYTLSVKNWSFPKFYSDKEQYIPLGTHLEEEIKSFGRCLRVTELVGPESIEHYLPHRVSMQFGMDQDIPGCVSRCNGNREIAWRNYSRPMADAVIYIPPRLLESDVTIQYSNWWKQSILAQCDAVKPYVEKPRNQRKLHVSVRKECRILFSNGYSLKRGEVSRGDSAKGDEDSGVEAGDLFQDEAMDDGLTIRELLAHAKRNRDKMVKDDEGECRLGAQSPLTSSKEMETHTEKNPGEVSMKASLKDQEDVILENVSERDEIGCTLPVQVLPSSVGGSQNVSSSIADKEDVKRIKLQVKEEEGVTRNKSLIGKSSSPMEVDVKSQPSIKVGAGERCITLALELEARICRLEKLSAELKKKRFGKK